MSILGVQAGVNADAPRLRRTNAADGRWMTEGLLIEDWMTADWLAEDD